MTLTKVYRPIEALPLMGVPCKKSTAKQYIRNMVSAGLFTASFKGSNGRWCIDERDIVSIKEKIMNGDYKPSTKWVKAA